MAKKSGSSVKNVSAYRGKKNISRPGVVAKTKQSKNKNSKNYHKPYKGQGR